MAIMTASHSRENGECAHPSRARWCEQHIDALLGAILSRDGTVVSYSAMSGTAISISPLDVIFKRITVRGFLLNDFDFGSLVRPAMEQATKLIAAGRLRVQIAAIYPLSGVKDAVAHTLRGGKVLLKVSPPLS
jgi:NADPH:quinone reductase-like Zn-dependent oxidoreductase